MKKRFVIREKHAVSSEYVYGIYDKEARGLVAVCDAGVIAEVICQALNDHNKEEHI